MKKLGLKIALIASVFLLAGNTVQAKETVKKNTGPSKYWAFLQGFEKGTLEKKTDELREISETLNDLIKARESFNKTCSKNTDPKCRELLESYLKIEISAVEELKKEVLETGINLKTALRNLSEL